MFTSWGQSASTFASSIFFNLEESGESFPLQINARPFFFFLVGFVALLVVVSIVFVWIFFVGENPRRLLFGRSFGHFLLHLSLFVLSLTRFLFGGPGLFVIVLRFSFRFDVQADLFRQVGEEKRLVLRQACLSLSSPPLTFLSNRFASIFCS